MPVSKKVTPARPAQNVRSVQGDAPPPPQAMPLEDQPTAWADVLGEIENSEDYEISIYAEPENGRGGAAWAFSCDPDEFPKFSDLLMRIKMDPDLGPGRYSARIKKGTQFAGSKRFTIAGRKRSTEYGPAQTGGALALPVADKHADFLQQMVLALIAKPAPEPQAGASITDVIAAAKMMTKDGNPFADIKQFFEMKSLLLGEGEPSAPAGDDALTAAIKTFGPALVEHASRAPAMPAIQNPAPLKKHQAAVTQAQGAQNDAMQNPMIKMGLGMACRAAQQESDPTAYAVLLLDMLGDAQAAELLARPDAMAALIQLEPRFSRHKPWVQAVINAALEMLPDAGEAGQGVKADLTNGSAAGNVPQNDPTSQPA